MAASTCQTTKAAQIEFKRQLKTDAETAKAKAEDEERLAAEARARAEETEAARKAKVEALRKKKEEEKGALLVALKMENEPTLLVRTLHLLALMCCVLFTATAAYDAMIEQRRTNYTSA